jgi:acyl carrier protein
MAPGTSLESQIAEVWAETLGVADVDVTDNFFDLGGHSMLAVRVHRRVRDELGYRLSLTDLFRFPTVRQLAQFLGATGSDADDDAVPAAVNAAQARGEARRLARQRIRVGGDR